MLCKLFLHSETTLVEGRASVSRQHREFEAERLRRLELISTAVLLGLIAVVSVRYASTAKTSNITANNVPSSVRLDPNIVPWWELTALPGIGKTRAQAITDYREQVRAAADDPSVVVFRCPTDLESVHGIGPKTVAKIARHLSFPVE